MKYKRMSQADFDAMYNALFRDQTPYPAPLVKYPSVEYCKASRDEADVLTPSRLRNIIKSQPKFKESNFGSE